MTMTEEITSTTLTVAIRDLWNAVKNIVLFTSKDDTLPVLSAAHFRIKDGNFIVEATDRYRLGQIMITRDTGLADTSLGVLANDKLKALETLLRTPAKHKQSVLETDIQFTADSLKVSVISVDYASETKVDYALQDSVSYPKIDSLFPKDVVVGHDLSGISFNPRYLKDMATLRDWRDTPNNCKVHFAASESHRPALFLATSNSGVWCQALLMPIRIDNDPVTMVTQF